jgi:hypothetical protein
MHDGVAVNSPFAPLAYRSDSALARRSDRTGLLHDRVTGWLTQHEWLTWSDGLELNGALGADLV